MHAASMVRGAAAIGAAVEPTRPLCQGGAHHERFATWLDAPAQHGLRQPSLPVSSRMAQASRSMVGNTQRLQTFLRKLASGECVNVAVFGGSVSAGTNVGGPTRSWAARFEGWLNTAHPPTLKAKRPHRTCSHSVNLLALGGTGSNFASEHFDHKVRAVGQIDLFIVEYAINDGFLGASAAFQYLGGKELSDNEFVAQWWTEILIRKCLLFRVRATGEPVALVYLESTYHGRTWLTVANGLHGQHTSRDLATASPQWAHHSLLLYYQIPTVNLGDVIMPLARRDFECNDAPANYTYKNIPCSYKNPFWENLDGKHPYAWTPGPRISAAIRAYRATSL
jgi:hypothetical protein